MYVEFDITHSNLKPFGLKPYFYIVLTPNSRFVFRAGVSLNMHSFIQAAQGARCSSVVRAFAHGAMGRRIDPSWGEPTELFLVPASAPRLVCAILSVGWCI